MFQLSELSISDPSFFFQKIFIYLLDNDSFDGVVLTAVTMSLFVAGDCTAVLEIF